MSLIECEMNFVYLNVINAKVKAPNGSGTSSESLFIFKLL